jgi:bla regulator protein BlaR1
MITWFIGSLLATSLLLAFVLLVRGPVLRSFGPKVAYALWALPALRLILPPLPAWFKPVQTAVGTAVSPMEVVTAGFRALDIVTGSSAAPGTSVLLAVWATGAIAWFAMQMLRYHGFLGRALTGATLLGRECGVSVLVSPAVTGPMATGIVVRRILLPADFADRYTSSERRLALLHEGAHHDRGDIHANFLALGIVAVLWWNPIAHYGYRCFRADQELACDATVLAGSGVEDRQTYGSALLKSASARTSTVACALSHKDELRRRFVTMMRPGFGTGRRITGAGGALTLVLAGALLTATAQAGPLNDMDVLSTTWFTQVKAEIASSQRELSTVDAEMDRLNTLNGAFAEIGADDDKAAPTARAAKVSR